MKLPPCSSSSVVKAVSTLAESGVELVATDLVEFRLLESGSLVVLLDGVFRYSKLFGLAGGVLGCSEWLISLGLAAVTAP